MIYDLRFIERNTTAPEYAVGKGKTVRILQAYDGHVWFDVPLITGDDNG